MSALIFAKEKIDFISKESINRKTAYWMRLWCTKAEQLKQKADLLFPDDSIVKDSYNEITADENRVNRTIKIKAIVGLVILVIVVVFCIGLYGTETETESKTNNDAATSATAINVKNFTFSLPDYWDEEGSKNEYLQ